MQHNVSQLCGLNATEMKWKQLDLEYHCYHQDLSSLSDHTYIKIDGCGWRLRGSHQ